MRLATWNVNSIRARLPVALEWFDAARPDIALLQETKVVPEQFPAEPFEERGYNVAACGEAGGRNGVAILAKRPLEDARERLPGDAGDLEARYLEAVIDGVRVASVYVPNGTAVGSDRFAYKLAFLERLRAHALDLLELEEALVIGGDYNVGPYPIDVFDPQALDGTICYHPAERAKLAEAPAVRPLAPREHPADRGREEEEQPERADRRPPGRSPEKEPRGDHELGGGESDRARAGPAGRDPEALERLARAVPIRELRDPGAGEDGREDQARARAAGCDGYLTKPVDRELLISTIRKHLAAVATTQS